MLIAHISEVNGLNQRLDGKHRSRKAGVEPPAGALSDGEPLSQCQAEIERLAAEVARLTDENHRLAEENRLLAAEVMQLRGRLGSVVPCSVWGYFAYPPRTIPPTSRAVVVSDGEGQVFRSQAGCEQIRRTDPSSASICFCVGSSFGP